MSINSSSLKLIPSNLYISFQTGGSVADGWGDDITYGYKIDITSIYPNYANLTVNNFIVEAISISGAGNKSAGSATITKSYDNSTGVLCIHGTGRRQRWESNSGNVSVGIQVYITESEIEKM